MTRVRSVVAPFQPFGLLGALTNVNAVAESFSGLLQLEGSAPTLVDSLTCPAFCFRSGC